MADDATDGNGSDGGSKDRATVARLDAKVDGLKDLIRAEFSSVERHRVEQKADTRAAVQAAFLAAKEAVKEQTLASEKAISKSEKATADQLGQLNATFTAAVRGVEGSVDDLKGRIGKIESRKEDSIESRRRGEITFGQVISVVMAALVAISIVAAATHGFQ
jgi:hypothetical protein